MHTSAPIDAATLLERQRKAFIAEGPVTARVRLDRLTRALDLLITHQQRLCDAIAADYGQRPPAVTLVMDVYPAVQGLRHARRSLQRWMRPRRVSTGLPLGVPGTRSEILYQPLGVVGIISPWNFPVALSFGPLAAALAAGNRCLVKPSEITAATTALMQELIASYFDPSEVAVVSGGPEVAASFSRLPFDHLMFTGSTEVGRRVMEAAARNLVPVTLELGGKCPAIVGRSADLARAVDRILLGKLANAGQVCLAPDHVLLPRERLEAFVREAQCWIRRAYPAGTAAADYTNLISTRHAARARELLADAVAKGGRTVMLDEPGVTAGEERHIPPTLILEPGESMRIMQEEIFAPILPVIAYDRIEEPIHEISRRARPPGALLFGQRPARAAPDTRSDRLRRSNGERRRRALPGSEAAVRRCRGERHGGLSRRAGLQAVQPCACCVPADVARPGGPHRTAAALRPPRAAVHQHPARKLKNQPIASCVPDRVRLRQLLFADHGKPQAGCTPDLT
jgi:coniferyl-aldehyde dehydrogenase